MRIFRYFEDGFADNLGALRRRARPNPAVEATVREVMEAVRARGDAAVIEYAKKFDRAELTPETLRLTDREIDDAADRATPEVRAAIEAAHTNVAAFAQASLRKAWQGTNTQGASVGERFDPFRRVGIYVPAGTAPLASTVLMTVTLAAVAGVPEIVVMTPLAGGAELNPAVAYALRHAGATEVYRIGGAHAIAALAFGTDTIRPVAKIFGPGNPWVVEAKRQVFGMVAIDLLPGPSEILVLADHTAEPAWIAADLLAQAEHGHGSSVGLVSTSGELLHQVKKAIVEQSATLSRGEHLREVLEENTWLVQVETLDQAIDLANDFAAEHVSIVVEDEDAVAARLDTSGALFLGGFSPVAAGDFLAGPSHELPTGGAGKSFPGLTVDQFQRRTSLVRFDPDSLRASLPFLQTFSEVEGLDAHGRSAAIRFTK